MYHLTCSSAYPYKNAKLISRPQLGGSLVYCTSGTRLFIQIIHGCEQVMTIPCNNFKCMLGLCMVCVALGLISIAVLESCLVGGDQFE